MKRMMMLIIFLTLVGISFAQQSVDSCVIKVPSEFVKEGCGSQQIHMHFGSNCPVLDVEITIYNRWGEVIYVSNELDHLWKEEKEKKPGTYFYKIEGTFSNGNKINQNGYFTII